MIRIFNSLITGQILVPPSILVTTMGGFKKSLFDLSMLFNMQEFQHHLLFIFNRNGICTPDNLCWVYGRYGVFIYSGLCKLFTQNMSLYSSTNASSCCFSCLSIPWSSDMSFSSYLPSGCFISMSSGLTLYSC